VRINAKSPIRRILEYSGMKLYPENGQKYDTASSLVVEFPVKAPDGAITNGTRGAIEQCEWWKMNKLSWTEHNPSVTILYDPDELEGVIDWVYQNQRIIGGMSFLPRDDHYYPLAPYEKITKEQYEELIKNVPQIDWENLLPYFESEDNTTVSQELACFSGTCEI
jgi:ribonucleoside-diphosphate reductase alpha chain